VIRVINCVLLASLAWGGVCYLWKPGVAIAFLGGNIVGFAAVLIAMRVFFGKVRL